MKGGGGGGTLIFSYINRLRSFLGVKNFESHYFGGGGGFRKINIFLGMTILWLFFVDHHKIELY